MLKEWLSQRYLGNTVEEYLLFLALFAGGAFALRIVQSVVLVRLKRIAKRTETTLDDFLIRVTRKMLVPLGYYGIFYLATRNLALSPFLQRVVEVAGISLLSFVAVQFLIALTHYGADRYLERRGERDPSLERALAGVLTVAKVAIWSVGIIFLLDNLGFNIASVIAGLGVGGLAVALAAQSVLGDLFSYFTILFDRPFAVGDFIIVGDFLGTVDSLGIKTTRLTSLGGEQIVLSNTDLTNSRVRNYKRMERRRVLFQVGVVYQTPYEQVREIPRLLEEAVRGVEHTAFDRAHFSSYGDFSLVYEVVYYVLGSDYTRYMNVQQEINFRIHEEFSRRGIEFAYPTQTLFLRKEEAA